MTSFPVSHGRARWTVGLVSLFALFAASPALAGPPHKLATVEGITEYRLDNGLRLLLFRDPSASTVTIDLTVLVGSRHEGYGEAGMAHLLEHMQFKGTPKFQDIPKLLKERGAQFNANTWMDRTTYFETLPAGKDNLAFALRLEADRLMNSFIRAEDLKSEMTVVRNEFEMGENNPDYILSQRLVSAAYLWHNYGHSTIGNRSDIERVPIRDL
jgi:zinc protease